MVQKVEELFIEPRGELDVLDAGCGTGLLAANLRAWARRLVGVDLSSGMLSRAQARNLYDELVQAELSKWLQNYDAKFDLVICADTLVYFGDLESVLCGMSGVMNPGAVLIFSLEQSINKTKSYVLSPSGRYSHNDDYIRQCITKASLTLLDVRPEVLRKEGGQDVEGFLVISRKSS